MQFLHQARFTTIAIKVGLVYNKLISTIKFHRIEKLSRKINCPEILFKQIIFNKSRLQES